MWGAHHLHEILKSYEDSVAGVTQQAWCYYTSLQYGNLVYAWVIAKGANCDACKVRTPSDIQVKITTQTIKHICALFCAHATTIFCIFAAIVMYADWSSAYNLYPGFEVLGERSQ